MAVLRKEYYTQLNGVEIIKVILKPTKNFPEGSNYFYSPKEAEELVDARCWFLGKSGKDRSTVLCHGKDTDSVSTIMFHKELFKFYHGYDWQEDIDHIDMVEIDNVDSNLNSVSRSQNQFNHFSRGYAYTKRFETFRVDMIYNYKHFRPYPATHYEDEACIDTNRAEQTLLKDMLGSDYYMFDFLKYRRGSEDILDLERTGVISEEEATYRHILRYADNAWYYLRYGLQEYFKEHNIPVPEYELNADGFMVNKLTRQKLCPFYKD